jgi:hypothetical protein
MPQSNELPPRYKALYRVSSIIWTAYAVGIGLAAHGSQILAFADPGRHIILGLAILAAVAMLIRLLVPGRPEWTRWALPLMGMAGVSSSLLAVFANEIMGGFTAARVAYFLLLLVPGLMAYLHWLGERAVSPR